MANLIRGLGRDTKGFWYFRPSMAGLPKGAKRPGQIYLGTQDEREAMAVLIRLRGLDLGKAGERRLGEWAEVYLDDRKRVGRHREQTTGQMTTALGKLVEYLGNPLPGTVTPAHMMAFYAWLQEGRTHGTVHRYMRYARALFYWLAERKLVAENPAARLRLPVVIQSRRDVFCTKAQRDKLLTAVENDPEMRFVFMAGFYLGLRINEIVSCRWGWFQGEGGLGYCAVTSDGTGAEGRRFVTKSAKARTVPLHPVFRDYLSGLERGKDDEWVLRPGKQPGKQFLRWDPRVPFNALCLRCGLAWVTPHTMRHTFGSLHAMAGTPELKIRRWMGITQQTLDRHYSGLSPDDADVGVI